jgi:hypothetical protein
MSEAGDLAWCAEMVSVVLIYFCILHVVWVLRVGLGTKRLQLV